jgi:hypothetical protein
MDEYVWKSENKILMSLPGQMLRKPVESIGTDTGGHTDGQKWTPHNALFFLLRIEFLAARPLFAYEKS